MGVVAAERQTIPILLGVPGERGWVGRVRDVNDAQSGCRDVRLIAPHDHVTLYSPGIHRTHQRRTPRIGDIQRKQPV
jgi:hypothetical protein